MTRETTLSRSLAVSDPHVSDLSTPAWSPERGWSKGTHSLQDRQPLEVLRKEAMRQMDAAQEARIRAVKGDTTRDLNSSRGLRAPGVKPSGTLHRYQETVWVPGYSGHIPREVTASHLQRSPEQRSLQQTDILGQTRAVEAVPTLSRAQLYQQRHAAREWQPEASGVRGLGRAPHGPLERYRETEFMPGYTGHVPREPTSSHLEMSGTIRAFHAVTASTAPEQPMRSLTVKVRPKRMEDPTPSRGVYPGYEDTHHVPGYSGHVPQYRSG